MSDAARRGGARIAARIAKALRLCRRARGGDVRGRDHGGPALLVNEIAPRVHNSGHWTLDGATVSQFEQHIRAVAGWPLGKPVRHGPVEMTNLIGEEVNELRQWLDGARRRLASLRQGRAATRPQDGAHHARVAGALGRRARAAEFPNIFHRPVMRVLRRTASVGRPRPPVAAMGQRQAPTLVAPWRGSGADGGRIQVGLPRTGAT